MASLTFRNRRLYTAKYEEGNHSIDETYREIRTEISVKKGIKTILVTSSEMNEGKTTTVSNLARCFSNLRNKRVLLIDCDFRKPSISKHFELENKKGLIDIVDKNIDLSEAIKKYENLDLITCGGVLKNPTELLDSIELKDLIENLKESYDYIFIDSPPVSRANDACVIAKYVDGVIIVSASNEVEVELAKLTKKRLEKVNANILGVVLNKFRSEGYKYYNYYGYYGEPQKKSIFNIFKRNKR